MSLSVAAVYATLGCKLNFAETSTLSDQLSEMGIRRAERGEEVGLCVVNTCAVTTVAETKCRQTIRQLIRKHPHAVVVVMGCYAQLSASAIAAIEGVSMVLGNDEKKNAAALIVDYLHTHKTTSDEPAQTEVSRQPNNAIRTFSPSCSRGNRTRWFLKVQDGCNYYCTYCTIPFARGRSRHPDIATLVRQAEEVAAKGGKEIVLTGVNIGHFGKGSQESFLDLVKALDRVEGIARYRISSIEPDLLDDALIEYCAQGRAFMPHFHLPLQSGSDEVLRLMHRRYDTRLFADKVSRIKQLLPHAFIGVDVMVGMRGETERHFAESRDFLSSLPISQLHVFPYSERPGTAALRIPHSVAESEKKERARQLIALSEDKRKAFYRQAIGQTAKVLLENTVKEGKLHGFTENYIRVELPASAASNALHNQIITGTLTTFNADSSALMFEKTPHDSCVTI